ncbi:MAG: thiamine pyrophosphate-dependent enzyme [Candidatus Woesearchaeota archaeon]
MFFKYTPPFPKCYKKESKPHKFCPGCGHGIALKSLGYVIDDLNISNKILIGVDIGCSLLAWDYFDLNTIQTHHGRTVPVISGYKLCAPQMVGIAYVGDGGAYAIGLQSLLTAAHRNDPITVIVINNTLYGMTGGQMAPTTLLGEVTTTTPNGNINTPIFGPELIKNVTTKNNFIARGIVSQPNELKNIIKDAIKFQIDKKSFSFVEILSMCPVNWKKNSQESLEFLEEKMAKQFKLGEI